MTSKPVLAASASENENVLFPDPASPVTMTRRPTVNGGFTHRSQCPARAERCRSAGVQGCLGRVVRFAVLGRSAGTLRRGGYLPAWDFGWTQHDRRAFALGG